MSRSRNDKDPYTKMLINIGKDLGILLDAAADATTLSKRQIVEDALRVFVASRTRWSSPGRRWS